MTPKEEPKHDLSEIERRAIVQLCIAEYQALTTRGSYWIVLQIGLLPVVPVYLVLAVTVWQSGVIIKEVVVWATLLGLQLIALLWAQTMLEQFAIVKYIECYLRMLVETVVPSAHFWGYEPFLVSHRPMPPLIGFLSIPFLIGVVLIVTVACRIGGFSKWDLAGLIVNVALMLLVVCSVYKAWKIQREWSKSDRSLAEEITDHLRHTEG